MMNPDLDRLHAYPFEQLRKLLSEQTPAADKNPISMALGEPSHPTPALVRQAYLAGVDALSSYPPTGGSLDLRQSIANWLQRRFQLNSLCPHAHVLPVNGTREALFAFAQAVIDPSRDKPVVLMPNPFYQIYEGAALLAKATPHFFNLSARHGFTPNWDDIAPDVWRRTQLVYVCSPGNPTGNVLTLDQWRTLFALADRYGFIIAADECYSEIYFDEAAPVLGALQAAELLARHDYRQLVVFNSLSKRSNVPGLRSGFVAGDANILKKFLLYRTYHGSAMSGAVSIASTAAWNDDRHVVENRSFYRQKMSTVLPLLNQHVRLDAPEASFFLWMQTPVDDLVFTQRLYQEHNVIVLPGSYLARDDNGCNPGRHFVRIALVASLSDCQEGAQRIASFIESL